MIEKRQAKIAKLDEEIARIHSRIFYWTRRLEKALKRRARQVKPARRWPSRPRKPREHWAQVQDLNDELPGAL